MGKIRPYVHAFNIGQHDKTALTRIDLERMRLAAEEQTNLMAKATGPGFMRPGLEYLGSTASNAAARVKEFVFGATDASLLEFSDQLLRVWVDDDLVTRPAVTSTVTSGDFSASAGWTLTATDGATSTVSGGLLNLTASGKGSLASAKQQVTTSSAGTQHALRIVIDRGPVTFRCGSTDGGDDYIAETQLRTGTHSLAFTPVGSYWIKFQSDANVLRTVNSVTVEAAGVMTLTTPWLVADLGLLRMAQSADVVFVAAATSTDALGYQQRRIERRGLRSWSVVLYDADDGPFELVRPAPVRLTPSVTEGNGTLTADGPVFSSSYLNALIRLTHSGQRVITKLSGEIQYTDPIKVTGINGTTTSDRAWTYTVSGTWVGTLKVFRSFDGPDFGYAQCPRDSGAATVDITANGTFNIDDTDDNAIVWYRIGFEDGTYTSGTAEINIRYNGGGGTGVCRVVGYTSSTVVDIEVLKPFKGIVTSDDWQKGEWSSLTGWPSAVAFSDGRLWWSGADRLWGSVSDAFDSFDDETEGDSAPISRSIATGGVNVTQWLMALQRLVMGTEGAVAVAKSSSLDEPLTATNLTIKDSSTVGAAGIDPIKVDARGLFVERAGAALLELTFDSSAGDYIATQMSKLTTDVFSSGVKAIAVQRRPDTRIWLVMENGSCVCCLYEPDQEVLAFIPIETDGDFESVAVLPAATQDRVFFVVNRTINGSTVRYVEKMALDSEVRPTTACKVFDAFLATENNPAATTVSGLSHLVGETVVVWADGAPVETSSGVRKEFTVAVGGTITLPTAASDIVVGLPYRMRYKSARLAYGASGGTALLQKKSIPEIGLIMTDFVRAGVKYGQVFDDANRALYPLPVKTNGSTAPAIVLSDVNDEDPITFGGSWDTDARVCIECSSPYTLTLLGLVLSVETNG